LYNNGQRLLIFLETCLAAFSKVVFRVYLTDIFVFSAVLAALTWCFCGACLFLGAYTPLIYRNLERRILLSLLTQGLELNWLH